MNFLSIEEFARRLRQIPEAEFSVPGVHAFLKANGVEPESLAPYVCYDTRHYTRNLIARTALYELLAICWDVGQSSPIHNHHGQNCWMAAPIGRLVTQNYRVIEQDEDRGACRLEPTDRIVLTPTDPLPVNPLEPVHSVFNPEEFGERAVSLHIYSRPYDRCLIYSLEKGTYGETHLSYTTQFGRPVPVG